MAKSDGIFFIAVCEHLADSDSFGVAHWLFTSPPVPTPKKFSHGSHLADINDRLLEAHRAGTQVIFYIYIYKFENTHPCHRWSKRDRTERDRRMSRKFAILFWWHHDFHAVDLKRKEKKRKATGLFGVNIVFVSLFPRCQGLSGDCG